MGSRFGRFTYRWERNSSRVRAEQDASSADVSRDRPVRFRASDRRWKVISVESEGKGGERGREGEREREREREGGVGGIALGGGRYVSQHTIQCSGAEKVLATRECAIHLLSRLLR